MRSDSPETPVRSCLHLHEALRVAMTMASVTFSMKWQCRRAPASGTNRRGANAMPSVLARAGRTSASVDRIGSALPSRPEIRERVHDTSVVDSIVRFCTTCP